MKLQDLFEAKIDFTPKKISKANFANVGKLMGSGVQAHVRDNKKTANSVIKIVEIDGLNDAAIAFTKLVISNNGNPFFPKIYNAKIYQINGDVDSEFIRGRDNWQDSDSIKKTQLKLVLHVEKLKDYATDNLQEGFVENLVQLGFIIDERVKKLYDNIMRKSPIPYDRILEVLINVLDDSADRRKLSIKTKSPQLKKALKILEPYFEILGSDMHEGNIMIRVTSTGPQLVIIDPFSLS